MPGEADHDGFTPLMVAAYYGHGGVVAQLQAAGAESGPRDSVGRTAFDWAREQRQPQSMLIRLKLDDDATGRAQSDRGGKFGGQPPPAPPAPADACPQYHTGRKQYDPSGAISPGR